MTETPQRPGHPSEPVAHGAAEPQPPYDPQSPADTPGSYAPPDFSTQRTALDQGQFPSVLGGDGDQGGTAGRRPRRRRAAIVVAVVTVLVLAVAGGGAAYWWLRGTKVDGLVYRAVPADASWNKRWVNGYREIWSLKATNGFMQGRFASVKYAEGKLIRATPDEDFVDVEVYSLTSKTPTLLFKDRFEGGDGSYEANVWQGWLIEKGELVNLESQKRQDAPWDDDAKVSVVGGYAIACEKAQCSMWSSSKERVWKKTLSFLRPDEVDDVIFDHPIGPYVSAHTGFRAQAVQSLIVDLRDGSSKSIKQEAAGVYPRPLADGWLLYDPYKSLEGPATVTLLKADGSVQETFEEGIPQGFKNYPWSPGYWTLDQARAWFKRGDTSWAPYTFSIDVSDTECSHIIVGGKKIHVSTHSPLIDGDSRFGCVGDPIEGLEHSGRGDIGVFTDRTGDDYSLRLVDMSNGNSPDPVPEGIDENYRIAVGDLLISYEGDGELTVYRAS